MKHLKRILQSGFAVICLAAAIAGGAIMPDIVFHMTQQQEMDAVTSHTLDALELSLTFDLSVYDKMHMAASCMEPKSAFGAATVSTEARVDFAMRYYIDRLVQDNYWISGVSPSFEVHLNYIEPVLYFNETGTGSAIFWNIGISLSVEAKYFYVADLVIDDETLNILSVQIETLVPGTGFEYADQSDMMGFAYSMRGYLQERDNSAIWMDNEEKYQPYYNGNAVHYSYMESVLLAREEEQYYRFYCSITPDGMYFNRTYEGY